ncbi:BolA family protein [Crenobacter cavernae]|uniref:BolA family transcriptional regulator n=1 Tax=Crenobacter cavernae TaxID=2290923 RepID=A0A345Y5H4_9NEIS|nr:BolA/IbaG family iron-sulfur metabolism protein [Crenobacter cavernae]AXK39176.1 BolA family transcriptional regulator [Crenobacter cavernae]RXZ44043.1 BolA/IbaG family iron-sulfur metabolism protein [Crenobacter cavernae]
MVTPELVKQYIEAGLVCTYLTVDGDGAHFDAVIVSPLFSGKRLIERHRLVNQALSGRLGDEIHALSMKTLSPEEWAEQQG